MLCPAWRGSSSSSAAQGLSFHVVLARLSIGKRARDVFQPSKPLLGRRRPQVATAVLSDPWKTLGVPHTASEAEVKRAHRKLVLQHHPDTKGGCEVAQRRFMAIQEAYELILGKRQGKEVPDGRAHGGNGAGNDWDLHDWYWKFSMSRRRRRAAAAAGAPEEAGMPPPHVMRANWRSQVDALRQKAASKRAQQRRNAQQPTGAAGSADAAAAAEAAAARKAAAAAAYAAKASSAAWRSTTKNNRMQPQPPRAVPGTLQGGAGAAAAAQRLASAAAAASSAAFPGGATRHQAAPRTRQPAWHQEEPPPQQQVHAEQVMSSAVPVDEHLHARLHTQQQRAGDRHHQQHPVAAGVGPAAAGEPSDRELQHEFDAAVRHMQEQQQQQHQDQSHHPQAQHQHEYHEYQQDQQQHSWQQQHGPRQRVAAGAADRERVGRQLAGLRRRAALKREEDLGLV